MKKIMILACLLLSFSANLTAQQILIKVQEMTCQLCAYQVNQSLRQVDGVITTKVNLAKRQVNVTAQPHVTQQALIQALEPLGYHAQLMEISD